MKKLLLKSLFLLTPFLVLTGYFVITDPMKIIHNTDNPVSPGVLMNDRLYQARYLESSNTKYNAFIFGSSRSKAFKTWFWEKHLPENATAYHMGVNDESLYGIERKLQFLDSIGYKPEYILLTLDHRLLSLSKNNEAHIFRDYYKLTGETASSFYQRFFIAFLKPGFLSSYWDYKQNGKVPEEGSFLWDPGFKFHENSGDIDYTRMDKAIAEDSLRFYRDNAETFHDRTPSVSERYLKDDALKYIRKFAKIAKKHGTEVQVIVTPNYDQVSIHPKDLKVLKTLFGKSNVHDFSGANEITNSISNYYEHKHFKPYISNRIMQSVYGSENK